MYENQPTKTSVFMQQSTVQSFCSFENNLQEIYFIGTKKSENPYIHLYVCIYHIYADAMKIKTNHVMNIHNLFFRKHMED